MGIFLKKEVEKIAKNNKIITVDKINGSELKEITVIKITIHN